MNPQTETQPSIIYCPSCGSSTSLPQAPSNNTNFFCDYCTSPNLLLSTNSGIDWNPLSAAFDSLSLNQSYGDGVGDDGTNGTNFENQLGLNGNESLDVGSEGFLNGGNDGSIYSNQDYDIGMGIDDELNRRSLILSNLLNFREEMRRDQEAFEDVDVGEMNGNVIGNHIGDFQHQQDIDIEPQANGVSQPENTYRTVRDLLELRRQSGMFFLDDVDTLALHDHGHGHGQQFSGLVNGDMMNGDGVYYSDMGGYQPNQGFQEEEGMFSDPPSPSVLNQASRQEVVVDDDDDEGQIYATPEQREEMRIRRRELLEKMSKEEKERELVWRNRYGHGHGHGGGSVQVGS